MDKKFSELLIEAIDKSLTCPVTDKFKYIKKLVEETQRKEQEEETSKKKIIYEKEFSFTFDELKETE